MDHIESICPSDKLVSLSKPRILPNLDKTLIVEVDVVLTTLVFRRKDDAIEYHGAYRDTCHDGRVRRTPYAHELPESMLSLARDRALDACADHDREPPTERRGAS